MAVPRLPNSQSAFVGPDGKPTTEFYSFLQNLSAYFIVGEGAPTITTPPQGALYLRTDGSSTSTRAYIKKASGWAAVTTAS